MDNNLRIHLWSNHHLCSQTRFKSLKGRLLKKQVFMRRFLNSWSANSSLFLLWVFHSQDDLPRAPHMVSSRDADAGDQTEVQFWVSSPVIMSSWRTNMMIKVTTFSLPTSNMFCMSRFISFPQLDRVSEHISERPNRIEKAEWCSGAANHHFCVQIRFKSPKGQLKKHLARRRFVKSLTSFLLLMRFSSLWISRTICRNLLRWWLHEIQRMRPRSRVVGISTAC